MVAETRLEFGVAEPKDTHKDEAYQPFREAKDFGEERSFARKRGMLTRVGGKELSFKTDAVQGAGGGQEAVSRLRNPGKRKITSGAWAPKGGPTGKSRQIGSIN